MVKISCKVCGAEHEYSVENFPLVFTAKRMQYTRGRRSERKPIGEKTVIVGYACKKCDIQDRRQKFIREQKIQPKPGQRMMEAIREKAEDIDAERKLGVPASKEVVQKGGFFGKIKSGLTLFKKGGNTT